MCGLLLINFTENTVLKTHRITRFVNSAETLSAEGTGYLHSLVRARSGVKNIQIVKL